MFGLVSRPNLQRNCEDAIPHSSFRTEESLQCALLGNFLERLGDPVEVIQQILVGFCPEQDEELQEFAGLFSFYFD